MRSRFRTDSQRRIRASFNMQGLGQDFYDMDYTTVPGIAAGVPDPAMSTDGGWFSAVSRSVEKLLPAFLAADAQKDLNALNLERARRGLAPISASYYNATRPQVNVGASPDLMNFLYIGGAVALGLFGLSFIMKRRR